MKTDSGWHSRFVEDGITRAILLSGHTRWQQIQRYVNRHRPAHWLAIDDDDDGWPEDKRHHLICTDGDLGLGQRAKINELRERLAAI